MNKVFIPIINNKTRNNHMIHDVKDCPCCGGEANIFREDFGKTVWIQCTECGLSTSRYDTETVLDGRNGIEWAVTTWNRRR